MTIKPGGDNATSALRGVKVFAATATAVANATLVAVAFDSEAYDTDGFHDPATNNDRITIPAGMAGKYLITGAVTFASVAGTNYKYEAQLVKNGVRVGLIGRSSGAAGSNPTVDLPGIPLILAAGDYLQFKVYQESGGSVDTLTTEDLSWFAATYLGA